MEIKKKFTEKETEEAFNGLEKIKEVVRLKNTAPLLLGQLFYKAKKEKWFKKNGLKRTDFMGDPEVAIDGQTVYGYEGLYKAYCSIGNHSIRSLSVVNPSRLLILKPYLFESKKGEKPKLKVSQEELNEWISSAKNLSTTDFHTLVDQKLKLKVKSEECHHKWKEQHSWQCEVCKTKTFSQPSEGE